MTLNNPGLPTHKRGIEGIAAITLSTDRWDEALRFFADWGLSKIPGAAKDAEKLQQWATQNGSQVNVVPLDAPGFGAPIETGPTLREVVWAVHTADDLTHLAAALKSAPGFEDHSADAFNTKYIKALDPHGLQIKFVVNPKKTIEITGASSNPWGNPGRIDAASPIYAKAEPIEIGHVVLFTTQLAQVEQFYAALGFVTSDTYPGRGIFMRCSEQGGHHDLFLLQVPGKTQGLNHIAFTVRDIHEVFGGGLHMDRCGWKTQLGPGRHPISSAYFWYFENPCGGLIEYNADEDHLTSQWQPRVFEPGPTVFAEWAVDGGLDGTSRRQKTAPAAASGKFLTEKK
jgi:catechol 2,3-dioxygenase-like lactoylglutathione lyase family enzyme